MATVTVSRSNVTIDEVRAVLARILGPRCQVTRPTTAAASGDDPVGDAATILVASSWFARATVRIAPATSGTAIHVTHGAAYGVIGLLLGSGLVRKVSKALERAPELATDN